MDQQSTRVSRFAQPSAALDVRLLGLVDFDAVQGLQEWLTFETSGRNDSAGTLLMCEHPPLVSIGREGSRSQILMDDDELAARDWSIRWISRGGEAVVHAPGQLAIYPLFPLERLGLGVSEYRQRLEVAILGACQEFNIPVKRDGQVPGLWGRGGMVAHFGATLKSGVTSQGMFLNVAPEPAFLNLVRTRSGERVTSLQQQVLRRISMPGLREAVLRHVAEAFEFTTIHIHTSHPQLMRTRTKVCLHV